MPETKKQAARTAIDRSSFTPSDESLLASFRRSIRGLSPATQTHYEGATRQFLSYAHAHTFPDVHHLTREHVEMWMEDLYGRYKVASVRNRFVGLQQFFNWMIEEGEITVNPTAKVKRPILDETRKDIVSPKQLAAVLNSLEKQKRHRECALIAFFYDTGLRAGEVADLLTDSIDLDTGYVVVDKTKSHHPRTARLSPKGVRYLDRYWRLPRKEPEYAFNGHRGKMTANGLYQLVRAVFEEFGFKQVIGPHDLRHTSATHIAEAGDMPESAMMKLFGWSDAKMARHYAAQAQEKAALEAHKRASPLERLPKK